MIHLVELLPVVHLYLSRAWQYYWSHSYLIMAIADGPAQLVEFQSLNACWLCERVAGWSSWRPYITDLTRALLSQASFDQIRWCTFFGPDRMPHQRIRDEGAPQRKSRMEYCLYSVMVCEIMMVLLMIWVSLSNLIKFFYTQKLDLNNGERLENWF